MFGIDAVTGRIRVLGPITGEQRVYGFDVKATDRSGADDGKSSIVNVFVSIWQCILLLIKNYIDNKNIQINFF